MPFALAFNIYLGHMARYTRPAELATQFWESYAREKAARVRRKIAYSGLAGETRPCHNRGRPVGIYRKILWLSFALANLQSISSVRFTVMNI